MFILCTSNMVLLSQPLLHIDFTFPIFYQFAIVEVSQTAEMIYIYFDAKLDLDYLKRTQTKTSKKRKKKEFLSQNPIHSCVNEISCKT